MTNLLRPGRLEVETDLLLGAEEVLLPLAIAARAQSDPLGAGMTPAARDTATHPATRPAMHAAAHAGTTVATPNASAGEASRSAPPARGFDAALFAPRPAASGEPRPQPALDRRDDRLVEAKPSFIPASAAPTQVSSASVPGTSVQVVIEDRVKPPLGPSGEVDKSSRLVALCALHAAECPHCTRAEGYTNLVFGEGNPDAEVVFVGEAPGETEDQTGRPFVGKAGEKLDEMIRAMGFSRGDVYIANVLKARPPANRTPLAPEIERCGPYLLAQLAVIRPKAIVTLGGPATKLLLQSELGITRLRGVLHEVTLGRAEGQPFTVPVMPTFHPAYLLRNYTLEVRRQMWEDLKKVLSVLGRVPGARESAT